MSTMENVEKRPQFGGRVLGEGEDVFKHNAWDNVEWDEEQESTARKAVEEAACVKVTSDQAQQFEDKADVYWDQFYGIHQNRFFKERNWLFTEFPDLAPNYKAPVRVFKSKDINEESKTDEPKESENKQEEENGQSLDLEAVEKLRHGESWFGQNSTFRILEIGCGTGSTVYPILEVNTDSSLMVYCCDLSATAVNLVQEHKDYSQKRCFSFVCDVTKDWSEAPFEPESLDIVTIIFVLSAIHPDKMEAVARNLFKYMKPGGQIFFRDYGRYDMAQLRFKKGKCIQDNFYVRGDGTRCYFFTQEEIEDLFTKVGFKQTQNLVDRRLQVNRGKKLKMYRVWIQAKFTKPQL
eukprot:TRINITY_DN9526_c0_g1_i1.p1 TRINITY_DN9526_c0_g1~~TRINITY_DN9526_c0_g1_i1.p1  ORF type:complete len:350 (+),score=70.47 TRINITY_DN9526_c0_g1_i1:32-1081(+)